MRTVTVVGRPTLPVCTFGKVTFIAQPSGEIQARHDSNSDGKPLLDLEAGTWEVNATVVGVPKKGLIVQPRPKSAAGWRAVALPPFAVHMVRERDVSSGVIFAAPVAGGLRDPSNVSGDLRVLLDGFECDECDGTGYQLNGDGIAKLGATRPPGALRSRTLVVGHIAHLPQDGRDAAGRSRLHGPPGRRPARPREPVNDAGVLLRAARRQLRRRGYSRSVIVSRSP